MVTENPTPKQFDQLIKQGRTIVDFWASWCGPCRSQSPIVDELERTTDVNLIKIDVDADEVLPQRYEVRSIPTLLMFEGGELINRTVGLTSLDELKGAFGL